MNDKDFYARWKEHRRHVPVPDHFTDGVMAAIEKQNPGEEDELPAEIIDFSNHLKRWAAAAGLLLLGLFRILYVIGNLLRTNSLMPY